MIDWFSAILPLAASEESGFLTTLVGQILIWGLVALGIGLVIFVHELGHFIAAKTFGVKCEKFYVGFDVPLQIGPIKFPRTLGKFQYGETEYGIGILPLGGYVKMLGQDDDPRKQQQEAKRIQVEGEQSEEAIEPPKLDPRSYPAKPVWQRMIIISAGVVMNVITGVLFAAVAFGYGVAYNPAIIGGVTPGGPAWQAGIEPGGQVISVGDLEQEDMHFREMRLEILTTGLDNPEKPIDIAIRYDDGIRKYSLETTPHPEFEDARMIGISNPMSTYLGEEFYAVPGTVAADVLGPKDAGGRIISYDGTPINEQAIVPAIPLLHYLYSNPEKTISLGIRRVDGSTHTVELPPQPAKTIGVRYKLGPVASLITGGPAERAGVEVGDVITAVDGDESVDAFGLPLSLVGSREKVKLTLRRGKGEEAKTIEVVLDPDLSKQSLQPASGMSGQIAIDSLGLSYRPLPAVTRVLAAPPDPPDGEESGQGDGEESEAEKTDSPPPPADGLRPGDEIRKVQLLLSEDRIPEQLRDERFELHLETLREGWEFDSAKPLTAFHQAIQILPEGTPIRVLARRPPEGRVVESTMKVRSDDRLQFERGLGLTASESIQTAGSVSEALTLGLQEGRRRFGDVIQFLGMLPQGKVKLRHVGGPLEIVNIAKQETERGISRQLMFLTMLSMNLAILNFLPIPALDGGHMMFLLYELIRGKRADEQIEFRLTLAGVIALLTLMVVVFANDIMRHL